METVSQGEQAGDVSSTSHSGVQSFHSKKKKITHDLLIVILLPSPSVLQPQGFSC